MAYRVLIPTAGIGSRLEGMTKYLNKSLVSIANRPALARIIEMFPDDAEFVVPTGYKGELVKEFLRLAYPDRKFFFSDVVPFEGAGSGLGKSILSCQEYLQQPFVFCSCDTLVTQPVPAPDYNWMGVADKADAGNYRTVTAHAGGTVLEILEKGETRGEPGKPYIGLAGIYDVQPFWRAMREGGESAVLQGECYGLRSLTANGIKAQAFDWFDTGTPQELERTRAHFREKDAPNILEKANEAIWFLDKAVIKFCDDTRFISERVKRAALLEGYVPQVTGCTAHMYRYPYAPGRVMSKCVTLPRFIKLLDASQGLWKRKELPDAQKAAFRRDCIKFYRDKTYERVALFYRNFGKRDGAQRINGIETPPLQDMLDSLDWEAIAQGIPGRFHGDYHFENILFDETSGRFTFLDWRQSFGSSLETGDIYYDLAKMLHGLIVCHDLIAKDAYWVRWDGNEIAFDFHRKQILVECERYFYWWLEQQGYDKRKVALLTALIYLNIAALHHHPYGLMLYALGKQMLFAHCGTGAPGCAD